MEEIDLLQSPGYTDQQVIIFFITIFIIICILSWIISSFLKRTNDWYEEDTGMPDRTITRIILTETVKRFLGS